jgi:hypoxanthine phosphoribosyltransferase
MTVKVPEYRNSGIVISAMAPASAALPAMPNCAWLRRMPTARQRATIHPDLAEVLLTEPQIKRRVKGIAGDLKAVYGAGEFTIVSLINGAVMFTADLMREIDNPVRLDCIRVSSYGGKTKSIGTPQVIYSLTLDIHDRHVLLIDDILDTGKTLSLVSGLIRELKPASLRTCVLLDKKERREVKIDADFVGFDIPNKFVVGYGLDFAERYRNLPYIGVLKPEKQNTANWSAG